MPEILKKTRPRSKFIRFDKDSERASQVFDKNGAHIKYISQVTVYIEHMKSNMVILYVIM